LVFIVVFSFYCFRLNHVCHAPLAASGLRYAHLQAMQADF